MKPSIYLSYLNQSRHPRVFARSSIWIPPAGCHAAGPGTRGRGTADGQVAARADTCVPGPPCCTYGLPAPAIPACCVCNDRNKQSKRLATQLAGSLCFEGCNPPRRARRRALGRVGGCTARHERRLERSETRARLQCICGVYSVCMQCIRRLFAVHVQSMCSGHVVHARAPPPLRI